jgi:hypothetical protein
MRARASGWPRFIEREFRRYLDCGLLCHGFARIRCPGCGHEQLLAFSCKGRLCPSCFGRRMADTGAYLVDQLLPEAGYRQWVVTFPWVLRFRLAVDRQLFTALLQTFPRTLFAWQRHRGRALGVRDGQTGAVSFLQRFGGALNLHPQPLARRPLRAGRRRLRDRRPARANRRRPAPLRPRGRFLAPRRPGGCGP